MAEFLDVAQDLWRRGECGKTDADFARVFEGISSLQQVHSKAQLHIKNVESGFAAF